LLKYAKNVVGTDILTHKSWKKLTSHSLTFKKGDSEKLPFGSKLFEGVFLKDLLHHVDDPRKALKEIKRVSKNGASIIIIEGNRYNPLFFLYATKINGHEHFTQKQFKELISEFFPKVKFKTIECYPPFFLGREAFKLVLWIEKRYEKLGFLKKFYSYNIATIKNE
jgi:SAM-dependent methyltransferase